MRPDEIATGAAIVPLAPRPSIQAQTNNDDSLIDLWLHGRSGHTQRAYRADVGRFLTFVAKPLATVTLGHLQAFADVLEQQDLAPSSRVRTFSTSAPEPFDGELVTPFPLEIPDEHQAAAIA